MDQKRKSPGNTYIFLKICGTSVFGINHCFSYDCDAPVFATKNKLQNKSWLEFFFFFFKAETSIMLVQQEAKSAPPGLEIWHHIQQGQTDARGLTMHLSPPYSQPQGASASVREGVSVWGTHRRTNTLTSHGSHKPKKMSTHSFKLTPRHTVLSLTANLLTTMGQQAPFFVLFTERLQ